MTVMEITLASVLSDIGTVFTNFTGYIGTMCEIIVSNPLLLLGFCVPFVYTIISVVKRLF